MENILEMLTEWGTLYGMKIVSALAIIVIGRMIVGLLANTVRRVMKRSGTDDILIDFVASLTRIGLLTFVFIAALNALGVHTTSFVAVVGAAGLAIGLAMQSSLANLASGVMLIIFRPFKTGDYVEAGGSSGSIEAITIFNTVLNTPDNKKVIIPNSKITGDNIVNYSAKEMRRIDMVFGIGYGDDLKKAKQLLLDMIAADDRILDDPAPSVGVLELADSSVNFAVRPWVKTSDYWGVHFDFTEKVKTTFDTEGISIPFPQTDVHLHQSTVV